MKTLHKDIMYTSRKDMFQLYPLFDIHLGAAACNEKLLRRDVLEISKKDNAFVVLGGDMIDAIDHQDGKRYVGSGLAEWCRGMDTIDDVRDAQMDMLTNILQPIRSKVIAVIEGNHEYSAGHYSARALYRDICGRIAGDNGKISDIALGVEGFLSLRFIRKSEGQKSSKGSSWPMVVYARHGYGGGRKKGGKINNLADLLYAYDCDLALSGHVHDKLYTSIVRTGPGSGRKAYTQKEIHGVTCGTYLAPYMTSTDKGMPRNGYGQRAGYLPNTQGIPRIVITPDKRRISITFDNVANDAAFDFDED